MPRVESLFRHAAIVAPTSVITTINSFDCAEVGQC